MRLDHRVLPPSVAAVVMTALALHPPIAAPERALRVESLAADGSATRLVRIAWMALDDPARAPVPPGRSIVRCADRTFVATVADDEASVVVPAGCARAELVADEVRAGLSFAAAPAAAPTTPHRIAGRVAWAIEGGMLTPELASRACIRVVLATDAAATLVPADATLSFDPAPLRLDGTGTACTDVHPRGLDALASIRVDGAEVTANLPIAPGRCALHVEADGTVAVRATGAPPLRLHALVRNAAGIDRESILVAVDDGHGFAAATFMPRAADTALTVALDRAYRDATTVHLGRPRLDESPSTTFARFTDVPTPLHPPVNVYDGRAVVGRLFAARVRRVRVVAIVLAPAAYAVLIALVLVANRAIPAGLPRVLDATRAERARRALGGAGVLVFGAVVLLVSLLLRGCGEG